MNNEDKKIDFEEFVDYCWSYYGPGEMFGEFFDHKLTIEELRLACRLRTMQSIYEGGGGDTVDREAVRDILQSAKGLISADMMRDDMWGKAVDDE